MWSLLLACGAGVHDESSQRCDEVTAQIDTALEDNIAKGVLFPTAVGCEITRDSFDSRVHPQDVEYLLGAFQRACATQALECAGVSTPQSPPSTEPPTRSEGEAPVQEAPPPSVDESAVGP